MDDDISSKSHPSGERVDLVRYVLSIFLAGEEVGVV
jgi:hypothetical protein